MLTEVRLQLVSDSNVSALVGTRGYVAVAAKNVDRPYIVVHGIAGDPEAGLEGAHGTVRRTFVVECWDDTPDGAETLATTVRRALDGFRGDLGNGGTTLPVGDMWVTDIESEHATEPGSFEIARYANTLTLSAWVVEAAPLT